MKTITVMAWFSLLLFVAAGCEPAKPKLSSDDLNRLADYGPVKVDILPLTEFAASGGGKIIKAYVSLLDAFNSQIKSPAVFRFELYNKVPLSAEPRGQRIVLWPDIDLNDVAKNNKHWNDFLRAYEFNLPFVPKANQSYILEVTSMCPGGKRLSAQFTLKP
jgi:hypothetical protein